MNDLTIDVSELKKLATDLRRASPILAKTFLGSLSAAGEIVASKARQKAASFPGQQRTDRIARSIKVRRRGTAVRIVAGGTAAPEAAAINNRGNEGTFRHPVFKNREVWVAQTAHPFLEPALDETIGVVTQLVVGAVDEAFIAAGWR